MSSIDIGGTKGPDKVSSTGDLGDTEFSPASLAVSETIDQALKVIFAGEKSSSLASPMELAEAASKPATQAAGKGYEELMKNGIKDIQTINRQDYLFPTGGDNYCTTESLEATMRYALSLGSKDQNAKKIFQACANTFAYLVREGKLQGSNGLPLEGYNQPEQNCFPQIANNSSATDSDIQLVSDLIRGKKIFGSITMHDGNESQSIDEYIKNGIKGLEQTDIVNGQWRKGSSHTGWSPPTIASSHSYDYVNYNSVRIITNYALVHFIPTKNIIEATNADLNYQINLLNQDQTGESYFEKSGEGQCTELRSIMHLGEYLLNANTWHPMYSKVKTLFKHLITKGFTSPDPWSTSRKIFSFYTANDGKYRADIRGDSKENYHWPASDGAMLVALKALKKIGVKTIPGQNEPGQLSNVEALIKSLSKTFKNDMAATGASGSPLQSTYFNAMVALSAFADINSIDK